MAANLSTNMADWEDLFAMAAGHEVNSNDANYEVHDEEMPHAKPQEKRKRKRQTEKEDSEFSRMLSERMSTPSSDESAWPSWLQLGSSHVCPGWEESSSEKSNQKCRQRSCRHCGRSPLHHNVELVQTLCEKSSKHKSFALKIFAAVRNIRCHATVIASSVEEYDSALTRAIQSEAKGLGRLVQSSKTILPAGEGSLLEEKCAKVVDLARNLLSITNLQNKDESGSDQAWFENSVGVIIACDAVYYRLYYLQITKALPVCISEGSSSFLPHPSDYFLVPYLCWDVRQGNRFKKEFIDLVRKEFHAERHAVGSSSLSILARYGMDDSFKSRENDNPLSALHCNRLMETVALFHKTGYMSSKQAEIQTLQALETKIMQDGSLRCHETPAPQILMEWRDSCRDLLCNLYAYAAIAGSTEKLIWNWLKTHNMSGGVVELGAGTGYISKRLENAGVHVTAWDARPTSHSQTMNEYHGSTPPFFNVQEGNVRTLKRHFRNGPHKADCVALLLCYPPPRSFMALDALETYMAAGGNCVLHIGEFHGLTGSAEFESFLRSNFESVSRIPCLTWGTDASDVTFWIRKDTGGTDSSSLLPCSECRRKPAVKRCRLARFLVYCGDECFRAHERDRGIAISLAMNSISLGKLPLEFDNGNHFVAIKSLDIRARSGAPEQCSDVDSPSAHKKQRNKRRKGGQSLLTGN